jgi:hypothetical protein
MNNFPMEYWLNFSHVDRGKQYLIIPECEILENKGIKRLALYGLRLIGLFGSLSHHLVIELLGH